MGAKTADLQRIHETLDSVLRLVTNTDLSHVSISKNHRGDTATTLDTAINNLIHQTLPQGTEGWLSEETHDDPARLQCRRLWVVDPIDGTREFMKGIPEWCVSIGLVEDGRAVAGGVLNPSTQEIFLGSLETGIEVIRPDRVEPLRSSSLLVSRREYIEGKWNALQDSQPSLEIIPIGSIAYRLAQVAATYAAATCTFQPRSEWDVAAGVALVLASGGNVQTTSGEPVRFNKEDPRLESFFAAANNCPPAIPGLLDIRANVEQSA